MSTIVLIFTSSPNFFLNNVSYVVALQGRLINKEKIYVQPFMGFDKDKGER